MTACTTVRVITELGQGLARLAGADPDGRRAPSTAADEGAVAPSSSAWSGSTRAASATPTQLVGILRRLRAR